MGTECLAPIRSFSKGAPTIFRKHMPSGMGTESLGMIGECIFAENPIPFTCPELWGGEMTSGKWTLSPAGPLMIGCIFAENGPLEGGIESSFWGTGWGAKGDFRRIFGPDPFFKAHALSKGAPHVHFLTYTRSRTHTFFESTCPELYEQQSWEWSRPLESEL